MNISCDLEKDLAEALNDAGIRFIHGSEKGSLQRLDFYLPEHDVYLEVKKFHSERSGAQLSSQENVILIQGRQSVALFIKMIGKFTKL